MVKLPVLGIPAFVAQRIEHLTTDQKVGGSSPSKRTSPNGSKSMTKGNRDKRHASSRSAEVVVEHCPFCLMKPVPENTCWEIASLWIQELSVNKRSVRRYLICKDCELGWFSLMYSDLLPAKF